MATNVENLEARITVVCAEIAAVTPSEDFEYKESLYKELTMLREQVLAEELAASSNNQQTSSITLI